MQIPKFTNKFFPFRFLTYGIVFLCRLVSFPKNICDDKFYLVNELGSKLFTGILITHKLNLKWRTHKFIKPHAISKKIWPELLPLRKSSIVWSYNYPIILMFLKQYFLFCISELSEVLQLQSFTRQFFITAFRCFTGFLLSVRCFVLNIIQLTNCTRRSHWKIRPNRGQRFLKVIPMVSSSSIVLIWSLKVNDTPPKTFLGVFSINLFRVTVRFKGQDHGKGSVLAIIIRNSFSSLKCWRHATKEDRGMLCILFCFIFNDRCLTWTTYILYYHTLMYS